MSPYFWSIDFVDHSWHTGHLRTGLVNIKGLSVQVDANSNADISESLDMALLAGILIVYGNNGV
jgi:hypothetical protein